MAKSKNNLYPQHIMHLMAEKTAILSKAQALADMALDETAVPLWAAAAAYEERLAPLLEALGREREAAVHRISAASCYQKIGELTRAANLYRAALAGPLLKNSRKDVQEMLLGCLTQLAEATIGSPS